MKEAEYREILDACGGSYETLAAEEIRSQLKAWREVYAGGLFAATGRWKLGPYDWHVFSFEHAEALNGDRALKEYRAQTSGTVVVHAEALKLPAVRLRGDRLPSFEKHVVDIYIWPENRDWTMVFTHESSLGLGPYFSRREWVNPPPQPRDAGERRSRQ